MVKRFEYLKKHIENLKIAIEFGKKILVVVDDFDGKIINKRFKETLKNEVDTCIFYEFSRYNNSFYIFFNSCPETYDEKCFFSVDCKVGFDVTESGKYRINAKGFDSEFKRQFLEIQNEIENLNNGDKEIIKIREEFLEIRNVFSKFKKEHKGFLLELSGCNYELRSRNVGELDDVDFPNIIY